MKPTTLPTWATDANFSAPGKPWHATSTRVAPLSAKLAQGFLPDERPKAQYFNWWKNLVYQWVAFLNPFFGDNGLIEPTRTYWQTLASVGNTVTNVGNAYAQGVGVSATAANAVVTNACAIDLKPGDRVTDISVMLDSPGGTQTVSLQLYFWSIVAGAFSFRSLQLDVTNPASGVAKFNASNATLTGGPFTVAADEVCHWSLSMGLTNTKALAVGVTKDRLNG
jgi:hypothetical protein